MEDGTTTTTTSENEPFDTMNQVVRSFWLGLFVVWAIDGFVTRRNTTIDEVLLSRSRRIIRGYLAKPGQVSDRCFEEEFHVSTLTVSLVSLPSLDQQQWQSFLWWSAHS